MIKSHLAKNKNLYFRKLINDANLGDREAILTISNEVLAENDSLQNFTPSLIGFYENHTDLPFTTYFYGRMYANGFGVEEDIEKAIELFEEARKLGCVDAIVDLGILASLGYYETSENLFGISIEAGSARGYFLKACVEREKLGEKKYTRRLKKAIDLGCIRALDLLGQRYHDLGKVSKALSCYKRGIKLGDHEPAFTLGATFQNGDKVSEDDNLAEKYFTQAVKLGSVKARVCLGWEASKKGNVKLAKKYYRGAIKRGDKLACVNMGKLCEEYGTKKESILAFQQGARLGSEICLLKIGKYGVTVDNTPEEISTLISEYKVMKKVFGNFGIWDE